MTTGGRVSSSAIGVGGADQAELDVVFRDALHAVAEFLHHELGGVGVERLGDRRHHAHAHQRLDDVRRAGGHAVGQFLHGDAVGQHDLAHDLHLIRAQPLQLGLPPLALALAADRGEAAHPVVLALDRGLHVDLRTAAAVVHALLRQRHLRLARAQGPGRAGAAHRTLVLVLAARGVFSRSVSLAGAGGAPRRRPADHPRRAAPVLGAPRGRGGGGRGGGRLGGVAGLVLGSLAGLLLDGALRLFLGGPAGLFLAAAGFLGGGEDRDLLLLAPLRLAPRVLALLLGKRALPRGELGRGQGPPGAGGAPSGLRVRAGPGRRSRRPARPGSGRHALLAHLDLHHLRAAMAETLSDGAGIHGPAQLHAPGRSQREPPLGRVLIVAFAHLSAFTVVPPRPARPVAPPRRRMVSASRPCATATCAT